MATTSLPSSVLADNTTWRRQIIALAREYGIPLYENAELVNAGNAGVSESDSRSTYLHRRNYYFAYYIQVKTENGAQLLTVVACRQTDFICYEPLFALVVGIIVSKASHKQINVALFAESVVECAPNSSFQQFYQVTCRIGKIGPVGLGLPQGIGRFRRTFLQLLNDLRSGVGTRCSGVLRFIDSLKQESRRHW